MVLIEAARRERKVCISRNHLDSLWEYQEYPRPCSC
jgi:hypothetical protein